MRAVLQRVLSSSVEVDNKITGSISKGINVLLGISENDDENDIKWLAEKIVNLRMFEDDEGKINKSVLDISGELLIISQFTLYGDCRKGRRPSFTESASAETARPLYNKFVSYIKEYSKLKTEEGIFQAEMKVNIVNDGPVTFLLDSKKIF
ncbi:MAG: D-tyrosyl-tRNA(Tyr) deacylase [Thermotogae bacterium]|nr:D-tyrosyl-tRNA(Tyr) deacylase [Thermotogota bacterium]HOO74831.1 D-aminoacyl-tRNA deacylase [Tepiditoga sp.]